MYSPPFSRWCPALHHCSRPSKVWRTPRHEVFDHWRVRSRRSTSSLYSIAPSTHLKVLHVPQTGCARREWVKERCRGSDPGNAPHHRRNLQAAVRHFEWFVLNIISLCSFLLVLCFGSYTSLTFLCCLGRTEDLTSAANLGRKVIVDMLKASRQAATQVRVYLWCACACDCVS